MRIDSTVSSCRWSALASVLAITLLLGATRCAGSKTRTSPSSQTAHTDASTRLEIAWPSGLSGTMLYEQTTLEGGEERSVTVTHTVATAEVDDGIKLAFSDPRDISTTGYSEEAKDVGLPTLKTLPAAVVREGAVVRVPNVVAVRDAIHESIEQMFGGIPGLASGMKSEVTNAFVFEAAQQAWASRGLAYHGQILAPGAEVTESGEVSLKVLQAEVPGNYVMTLEEHLTCPGTSDRRCIKLRRTLELEPEVLRKAFDDARGEAVDSGSVERSFTAELIADARTLLPYRLEEADYARLVEVRNGEERSRVQRETVVETYTWE